LRRKNSCLFASANGQREGARLEKHGSLATAAGNRRLKTFPRKKEADAFAATARVEVGHGIHVPDRASVTVKQAGALWLAAAEATVTGAG
jgi:hypothetical protein